MNYALILPKLEKRFLPPDNWWVERFNNPDTNHNIAYRTAFIDQPKAILFILPGLSEFGEKYIETARFFNAQGFDVVTLDWAYQGLSNRLKDFPQRRYSDGYKTDLSDLNLLIKKIASPLPHYMLAHSMGGHIGLRYIAAHPEIFQAAALSTPMISINALKYFCRLTGTILSWTKPIHKAYIPGGKDWNKDNRVHNGKDIFSSDPIRDTVHNAWSAATPALQIGNPTYKWLAESLKSICALNNQNVLNQITCPVLLACAGQENLVDNEAIIRAAKYLPRDRLIYIEHAKHELLMETDDIRDQFLDETLDIFGF